MANKFEIIVGTYEEFLLGYTIESDKDANINLSQSFATRSHTGSIRCIASNGRYVASGGADDRVFVYDMKTRKEIQVLMHHDGTINALAFTPDGSHILSGADDGKMIAIRTNSWQIDGFWKKAHGGMPVTEISCHPTGKLALTLGNDLSLRTWNLIKGRVVYTTNLKSKKSLGGMPNCISWSPNGEYFTIFGPAIVEIWSVETAGMIKEQNSNSKPICVCWLSSDIVLVGLENGEMIMLSVKEDDDVKMFAVHKGRVKSICYINDVLATVSSSGELCVWNINLESKVINKITSTNIGCRPTCIQILDLTQFGDDYKIVKEEDCEIIPLNSQKSELKNKESHGSVKIEYDDDDENENNQKSKMKKFNENNHEKSPLPKKKKKSDTVDKKSSFSNLSNASFHRTSKEENKKDFKHNLVRIKKQKRKVCSAK